MGLVGLPNAGKSSLLGRLTRAHPKVADYPFTTLEPVLGTLETDDRQLVIADIPGLIEGASAGAGLGHDFLAHIERTRLLVHVLDLAPLDGSDPEINHATVERELELHNPRLAVLPRVLALSKADLVDAGIREAAREAWAARWCRHARDRDVVGDGPGARRAGGQRWPGWSPRPKRRRRRSRCGSRGAGRAPGVPPRGDAVLPGAKIGDRVYRVSGRGIERLVARYDLNDADALAYLERRLRGIGVIRALQEEGFEPGDEVEIAGIAFDLDPE